MKALTVRQPWCEAILRHGKDVENRHHAWGHRGLLAVHAGQQMDRDATDRLRAMLGDRLAMRFPLGSIVGVVQVIGSHRTRPGCCTSSWAKPGARAHILLGNPRPLRELVPCRGTLGLWTVPPEIEARMEWHDA